VKEKKTSNIDIFKDFKSKRYNIYWGDIHEHSSLSPKVFFYSPEFYYIYARDNTHLDFSAMADHDDLGGVSNIKKWRKLQDLAHKFYEPHKFVTFIGYEWTSSNDFYDFFDFFAKGSIRKKILNTFSKALIRCKAYGHRGVFFPSERVPERNFPHLDPDSNTVTTKLVKLGHRFRLTNLLSGW